MKHRIMLSVVVALWMLGGTGNAHAMQHPPNTAAGQVEKAVFRKALRTLWEDHVTWTRLYIISALEDLEDKKATTSRLLQNQTDIGNAIKPFYGETAGNALTALLREHILIAAQLIEALKNGDTGRGNDLGIRWNTNADEIAAFLSTANPENWPANDMKSMMREHLTATTAEVAARLNKDWSADVQAYDEVHRQILHMADMLSEGIINQFQANFN